MDFWRDINLICLDYLKRDGFQENMKARNHAGYLVDYLNWQARLLPARPRDVVFSKEFQYPSKLKLKRGLDYLLRCVREGKNLSPFMSRGINLKKGIKYDEMLNQWCIYHFHMSETLLPNGFVKGNDEILFAMVDDDNFYCIKIGKHDSFSDKKLLDIVYYNWSFLLEPYMLPERTRLATNITNDEFKTLHKKHINAFTPLPNGRFVFLPSFGSTACGSQIACQLQANYIKRLLIMLEKYLSSPKYRQELCTQGWSCLCKIPATWRLTGFLLPLCFSIDDISNGYRVKFIVKNQKYLLSYPYYITPFYSLESTRLSENYLKYCINNDEKSYLNIFFNKF